jgi:hypothetical protein
MCVVVVAMGGHMSNAKNPRRGEKMVRLHPTPILLRDPAPLGARAQASAAERRPPLHPTPIISITSAQSSRPIPPPTFETLDYIRARPGATAVQNRRQVNAQQEQLELGHADEKHGASHQHEYMIGEMHL